MTDVDPGHLTGLLFDWVITREQRFIDSADRIGSEQPLGLRAGIEISRKIDEEGKWCRVRVRVQLDPPENEPQTFVHLSAAVEGQFSLTEESELSVEDVENFAKHQAPAILMPFARTAIASATTGSRLGVILMPPINVASLTEVIEEQSAAASKPREEQRNLI